MEVTEVEIFGLEGSLVASGYPKSVDIENLKEESEKNKMRRAKVLAQSPKGEGHDNFLNGIIVSFDLKTTLKMWTQLQRYHFVDFVSSQSTMHMIANFDLASQCSARVDSSIISILADKISRYNYMLKEEELFIEKYGSKKKYKEMLLDCYLNILHNIPSGFLLNAKLVTNYRQLKTIYSQRKYHKLEEWREFCDWIETLPMADELILNKSGKKG